MKMRLMLGLFVLFLIALRLMFPKEKGMANRITTGTGADITLTNQGEDVSFTSTTNGSGGVFGGITLQRGQFVHTGPLIFCRVTNDSDWDQIVKRFTNRLDYGVVKIGWQND